MDKLIWEKYSDNPIINLDEIFLHWTYRRFLVMLFDAVYYEPDILNYELGKTLHDKYKELPWIEIKSHNRIPELSSSENKEFPRLKQHLIIGTRKTHRYVENHKISDWLVPYTSSGCRAMCLYCYLVCNYNKCSYLRLFVNREQMMEKLLKRSIAAPKPETYEIGSNSDLVLENTITDNLNWTIELFAREGRGFLTFPTKFDMVESLLNLDHKGKTIFRMSVNPTEIILMTYSFVHKAINAEAFPGAVQIYDKDLMTGRGRGKYAYRQEVREDAEAFLREELKKHLGIMPILYIS